MAKTRTIQKVIKSKPTLEGAGVHLRRAFGFSEIKAFLSTRPDKALPRRAPPFDSGRRHR